MRSFPDVVRFPAKLSSAVLRELLREFGSVSLSVQGDCMAPVLLPGARVRIESRRPRLGEVALVEIEAGLRLHRVVWAGGLGSDRLLTRGDRAFGFDPPVSSDLVLGTATHGFEVSALSLLGHAVRALARAFGAWLRASVLASRGPA